MKLQLRPELQKFVEDKVKTGEYSSCEEVVEAGLARLMLDPAPSPDEETLTVLEAVEAQADRGAVREWTDLKAELLGKYLRR